MLTSVVLFDAYDVTVHSDERASLRQRVYVIVGVSDDVAHHHLGMRKAK